MTAYCKHCHCSHAAWNRLTNGYICGLCGTRERDPQVTPVNAIQHSPIPAARISRRDSPRLNKG